MIRLFINYKEYIDFTSIRVTKPLNGLAGSFEFNVKANNLTSTSIKLYDTVTIKIDGKQVLEGYIDPLNTSYDKNTHSLTISGYDKTKDIVDCSIVANTQYSGNMTFASFCEKVLVDNGLTDIFVENTNVFAVIEESETLSSKPGKSVFEFLDEVARKKGALLSTNGNGNLVLYNNTGVLSGIIIRNEVSEDNNTIRSGEVSYDMNKRFRKIIVKSQGGKDGIYGMVDTSSGAENIEGIAYDSEVKRNRTKVIISKTADDSVGCKKQAEWEVNKRRSDSISYTIEVKNHSADNGDVYFPGLKLVVRDDFADIRSIMLVNSVVWNQTLTSRSTELSFVANDAYSFQTEDPTKNINKVGENTKGEEKLNVIDYQDFLTKIGEKQ